MGIKPETQRSKSAAVTDNLNLCHFKSLCDSKTIFTEAVIWPYWYIDLNETVGPISLLKELGCVSYWSGIDVSFVQHPAALIVKLFQGEKKSPVVLGSDQARNAFSTTRSFAWIIDASAFFYTPQTYTCDLIKLSGRWNRRFSPCFFITLLPLWLLLLLLLSVLPLSSYVVPYHSCSSL